MKGNRKREDWRIRMTEMARTDEEDVKRKEAEKKENKQSTVRMIGALDRENNETADIKSQWH